MENSMKWPAISLFLWWFLTRVVAIWLVFAFCLTEQWHSLRAFFPLALTSSSTNTKPDLSLHLRSVTSAERVHPDPPCRKRGEVEEGSSWTGWICSEKTPVLQLEWVYRNGIRRHGNGRKHTKYFLSTNSWYFNFLVLFRTSYHRKHILFCVE